MSDGPYGVRTWGRSAGYAAGTSLAAAWDPELARRVGRGMAVDARARGVHVLLAPGVNIYRTPMNGRNFEYFGEDPFLAARTAVGFIEGVQGQGVVATVKHFAGNNSEYDRHNLNAIIDERTLHELYLPAFEASVGEAHVGAVMDSYNLVNGQHMTENRALNQDVLKGAWAFGGLLMSDWTATYDGIAAANAGLDLEMPSAQAMTARVLRSALQDGKVTQPTIDDKVRRLLRTAVRFGFLDRPQEDSSLSLYDAGGRRAAYDAALESLVLLRNEHQTLPLDATKVKTLAVIGPNADHAAAGGGSSEVSTFSSVSPLEGIARRAGSGVNVPYARGIPSLNSIFNLWNLRDLQKQVYAGSTCTGTAESTTHPGIISDFKPDLFTLPAKPRCVRWTGSFTPAKAGQYTFLIASVNNDSYRLRIDGESALQQPSHEGQVPLSTERLLSPDRPAQFEIEYHPRAELDRLGFGIIATGDLVTEQAKIIAAQADAAVICVGYDPVTEAESFDRPFELPYAQAALIRAVAAVNSRTIVVVNAGGSYDTSPWLDQTAALIQAWYPGEQGGDALAEVLFGHSPEGKLPMSFERSWADNPVHDTYFPDPSLPGPKPAVRYSEGLFVGYRYYESRNKPVLFPFGFGLSYTSFRFHHLRASVSGSANGAAPLHGSVEFDVTNTGKVEGAEVAQLFVGQESPAIPRPVRELKGFQKVRLAPGATIHVSLPLDARSFAYWDVHTHGWAVAPGRYRIQVGDSSLDLPVGQEIDLR